MSTLVGMFNTTATTIINSADKFIGKSGKAEISTQVEGGQWSRRFVK